MGPGTKSGKHQGRHRNDPSVLAPDPTIFAKQNIVQKEQLKQREIVEEDNDNAQVQFIESWSKQTNEAADARRKAMFYMSFLFCFMWILFLSIVFPQAFVWHNDGSSCLPMSSDRVRDIQHDPLALVCLKDGKFGSTGYGTPMSTGCHLNPNQTAIVKKASISLFARQRHRVPKILDPRTLTARTLTVRQSKQAQEQIRTGMCSRQ